MKRCTRTVWKTMLVVFSTFSCLLQGMGRYFSRKCVAIVNHKRVVHWVNNYTKMKYMLGKHDAWCGAMVWPPRALVKILSCTPFINRIIIEEVSWFRGGNQQD